MSRGHRRDEIFLDDVDRHYFLNTLAEACQNTGWQAHANCLLGNHYHLVLERPNANLARTVTWCRAARAIQASLRSRRGSAERPPSRSKPSPGEPTWAAPCAPTSACTPPCATAFRARLPRRQSVYERKQTMLRLTADLMGAPFYRRATRWNPFLPAACKGVFRSLDPAIPLPVRTGCPSPAGTHRDQLEY